MRHMFEILQPPKKHVEAQKEGTQQRNTPQKGQTLLFAAPDAQEEETWYSELRGV